MTYLLDTHTFLWLAVEPQKLSPAVQEIVEQGDTELLLSAASGWEIALLVKLGRIELPKAPNIFIPSAMQTLQITPLPIGFASAIAAACLPLIHRDPFDRILAAEALRGNITLLSKDEIIAKYGVRMLW